MGRPLKIYKTNGSVDVDLGYPNDGTTDNGFTTSAVGVVGGVEDVAAYPKVCVAEAWYGSYYASTSSPVISSRNAGTLNSGELDGDALIYFNGTLVGAVLSESTTVSMTTSATTASTDTVTVDDTTGLVADGSVVFGANIGGLVAGTVYFVKTVASGTTFTVSATIGGAVLPLTDDTVTTTAIQEETITLTDDAAIALNGERITVAAPDDGYIIRQKGKKKFLVVKEDTVNDEHIAAGGTYYIRSVGNTDWQALGAGPDAGEGKIFVATRDGLGLSTTGTVYAAGICTLVDADEANLTIGQMSIVLDKEDPSSDVKASTISNKFALDFTDNGTDENPGSKVLVSFDAKTNTPDAATGLITVDIDYSC